MSLRDDGKVYLEVGVNEVVGKEDNPNVPYGAAEVARDVVDCIRRGATVVHFHARYDNGIQAWVDDEVSRTILAAAAEEVDPLAYPSYHGSLDHIWALAERPPAGTRLLLTPFDPVQHVKRVLWLEDENRFGVVSLGPTIRTTPGRPIRRNSTGSPNSVWCRTSPCSTPPTCGGSSWLRASASCASR